MLFSLAAGDVSGSSRCELNWDAIVIDEHFLVYGFIRFF